jgi:hypothetical protein
MYLAKASLDAVGIVGEIFQLSFMMALGASTILVFFYLWRKKRLDMDESPKQKMLEVDEYGE